MRTKHHIRVVPELPSTPFRACAGNDPGGAALENHERIAYQSARTKGGKVAPLPLTYADALAEAEAMTRTGKAAEFPVGELAGGVSGEKGK